MDQVTKLQVVAKKLEKMLETSLHQLKLEQKLRKEGEEKIQSLEKQLTDLDQSWKVKEEEWHKQVDKKEEKIINLEASAEYLQLMVVQKDDEITKKQKMIKKLRSMINIYNLPKQDQHDDSAVRLDRVSQYEKRLSELMEKGKPAEATESPTKVNNRDEIGQKEDFKNTSFIEVAPIIKERPKRERKKPNYGDFEMEYEIKSEKLEQKKIQQMSDVSVNEPYFEDVNDSIDNNSTYMESKDDNDNANETLEQKTVNSSPPVKLEPRDQKSLLSQDNKKIKHKTYCKVCQEEFLNRKMLLEHEKISGHYLKFPCKYCDKKFRQKIQVERHEAQIHSTDMPFQCNRCDRKFKSEFSWKRHQDNDEIHKKIKDYTPYLTCEVCGKQFERRRRWCLDQHMLTHEPDKKHPCDICGKHLRSASYLQTHMKACSGIKEEECAYCGKRFAKKSVLINHERLHTGETPYQCRICDERFRTHHKYTNHGKNQHNALSARHFNQLQESASMGEHQETNRKEITQVQAVDKEDFVREERTQVIDTEDYVFEVVFEK